MKKISIILGSFVLTAISAMGATGQAPKPESCTVGDRPFTRPLDEIGFYFDGGIKLLDGASATVKCDGETVAVSTRMEVSNYTSSKRTQGSLAIFFDGQNLPKGKDYTLTVARASVTSESGEVANAEFSQTFSVPATLGPVHFDVENGMVIEKTSRYGGLPTFYWGIETEPAGEPSFVLYRDGEPVRELRASIVWDWDLGQAHPVVDEEIRFEKDVNYSLVLPAGSARAMYREDIVNEEAVFNFVGGYEETAAPLTYVWCSLFTDHSDVLDVVTFTYDRPVRVAEGARFQLWETESGKLGKLVKEADAYLDTRVNCWAVSADFGGFRMLPETGYTFVIPEGAVIADDGDPAVNTRTEIPLNGKAGIGDIQADFNESEAPLYDLLGREIGNPQPGTIYVRDGKKILQKGI